MSVSGNRISPPVTIEDLMALVWVRLKRTVNGVEQTILSSDLGVLCGAKIGDTVPAHDNLGSWTVIDRVYPNKWARYHPMRYNTIPYITHAKRKEYHFGLDVPFCNAYAAIGWHACCMNTMVFDIIYAETYVGWEYLMPRGDRTAQGGKRFADGGAARRHRKAHSPFMRAARNLCQECILQGVQVCLCLSSCA